MKFEMQAIDPQTKMKPTFSRNEMGFGHAGQYASDLVKLGFIGGVADGENSDGSCRFRILTPEELVMRAVCVSELLFARMAELGWAVESPTLDQLVDETSRAVGFMSE